MERNVYKDAFEKKCFRLIIEAYYTSLTEKVIQLDWNENDISYELFEKMEDNPKRIKYKIHLAPEFRVTKDTPKKKGFADKLPRIDLKMSNFGNKEVYKFFLEAKRLKEKDSDLKRAYIKEGMYRFITKKYPSGNHSACMVGFLQEGKIDDTIKGINSLLVKYKRNTEILEPRNNKICPSYYESYHTEIGVLKHVILNFTDISN